MKKGVTIFYNKKFLLLVSSFLILIVGVSLISANSAGCCIGSGCYTLVNGNVYYAENGQPVEGAEVTVSCKDNNHVVGNSAQKTESSSEGNYYVVFCSTKCDKNDLITVTATDRNGLRGEKTGIAEDVGYINVALINVPIVPEFKTIVGVITIFGALGTFLIIRRR